MELTCKKHKISFVVACPYCEQEQEEKQGRRSLVRRLARIHGYGNGANGEWSALAPSTSAVSDRQQPSAH